MQLHPENMDEKLSDLHRGIGGTIYLTIGAHCFPEENWYDYVSLIMESGLLRLPPSSIRIFAKTQTRDSDRPGARSLRRILGETYV